MSHWVADLRPGKSARGQYDVPEPFEFGLGLYELEGGRCMFPASQPFIAVSD